MHFFFFSDVFLVLKTTRRTCSEFSCTHTPKMQCTAALRHSENVNVLKVKSSLGNAVCMTQKTSRGYAEGNSLQAARAIKLLMDIKLYVSEISSSFSLKCTHPILSRLSQCHTGWVKVIRVNQGVCGTTKLWVFYSRKKDEFNYESVTEVTGFVNVTSQLAGFVAQIQSYSQTPLLLLH